MKVVMEPEFPVKTDPAACPAFRRDCTEKHCGVWEDHGTEGQCMGANRSEKNCWYRRVHYGPASC